MAVLKNKTQGQYTVVSQNIMRDKTLSLTERGMLLTLLSLPDNWQLTIMGLCQILPDGKDKVSRTLNSLIDKGYVTREQSRGGSGQFNGTDLEVHETPVRPDPPKKTDKNETSSPYAGSPYPENPHTVNPHTDNPYTDNPPQSNTNISNNHISNTDKVCKADTLTEHEYENLVLEFGQANVDRQIQRIKENNYKGCLNYDTIHSWCTERKNRPAPMLYPKQNKSIFCDFPQHTEPEWDDLERLLVCN